jgi:L-rhamnose isomerase
MNLPCPLVKIISEYLQYKLKYEDDLLDKTRNIRWDTDHYINYDKYFIDIYDGTITHTLFHYRRVNKIWSINSFK